MSTASINTLKDEASAVFKRVADLIQSYMLIDFVEFYM